MSLEKAITTQGTQEGQQTIFSGEKGKIVKEPKTVEAKTIQNQKVFEERSHKRPLTLIRPRKS